MSQNPRAILCLSVVKSTKGLEMLGSVRAGAERMACLRVLKAEWILDFISRGSERPPRMA